MKLYFARVQRCNGEADGENHDRNCLNETETAVNSEIKISVFGLGRVPEGSVRPEVEPVVGADGRALVEKLHSDAQGRSDKSDILKVVVSK